MDADRAAPLPFELRELLRALDHGDADAKVQALGRLPDEGSEHREIIEPILLRFLESHGDDHRAAFLAAIACSKLGIWSDIAVGMLASNLDPPPGEMAPTVIYSALQGLRELSVVHPLPEQVIQQLLVMARASNEWDVLQRTPGGFIDKEDVRRAKHGKWALEALPIDHADVREALERWADQGNNAARARLAHAGIRNYEKCSKCDSLVEMNRISGLTGARKRCPNCGARHRL